MQKQKSIIFSLLLLLVVSYTNAKVSLPAIVSSNMVLQRNTTVKLWGWADSKENIAIQCSWLESPLKIKADKNGNWEVEVKTTNSKNTQSIVISDNSKDEIRLDNVLFGEVWLCSGQSNMQMPLNGYTGQPVLGSLEAIAKSNNPNIRVFFIQKHSAKTPLKDVAKYKPWEQANPDNIGEFSAVAYFFGKQLQEILDVPVGLIESNWGGSKIQSWMSTDALKGIEEFDMDTIDNKHKVNHSPTLLYNAMIDPIIQYSIKGALWYQGESNRDEPKKYTQLFPAMVKDWRSKWNLGDFPFYYVQIAPYNYKNREAFETIKNTAYLREAQLKCLELIPNSKMAVTMDIGEVGCIHPARKKEVADRLLYCALNNTYGFKNVDCSGPVYKSLEVKDGGIYLNFSEADNGIYIPNGLNGFYIAGEDKVFYPAEAKMYKRQLVFVKSKNVENPVAVRYCWQNWIEGTLFDTNLLPASSFRTDNWDDAIKAEKSNRGNILN